MENCLNPDAPQGYEVAVGGESTCKTFVADGRVGMLENVDHFAVANDLKMAMRQVVRSAVGRMRAHIRRGAFLLADRQQRLRRAEQQVLVWKVVGCEPLRRRLRDGGTPIGVLYGAYLV